MKCCLCKENYTGFGNNAQPLKNGRCCDMCNATKVIPARMKGIEEAKNMNVKLAGDDLMDDVARRLIGNIDAKVWAEEFVKKARKNPAIAIDEGNMIGWFANAINAGIDSVKD